MVDAHPGDGGMNSLEHYWKYGAGSLKILWGAPGDFTRCVRHLEKHVANAEGICATWHHEVVGYWPGDRRNK